MNTREVELSGHIIDSLILPKVLDVIMDMGGDFKILEFEIGKRKTDPSYAKILVSAKTPSHLNKILDELSEIGASIAEIKEVELRAAEKDKVLPAGFYSTTNHPTFIFYEGEWRPVQDIEMDCMIVVDPKTKTAKCKPIGEIKKGDLVVVGREGIRVSPPERPRGKKGIFEFMGSAVSSEKPLIATIKRIASEITKVKNNKGKIALVAGPAVVHTGSAPIVAEMIREGFIDVLFAGNALATHDIENALYGTSLGICVKTGESVSRGHHHHIYAINEINRAGSIKAAVKKGILKEGIMYECVKNNIPFVLAGSIRDDGPLPDVITDVVEAQNEMRRYIREVDMVLMIATMLHSIAVGNLLPSHVKSICVDINPAAVTKLADRGSSQVVGVVTDVGAFLPILWEEIKKNK
ncbi:MAG TPA: TIGR00300 family protein [Methanothermobacter sp.]|jgi:lysine-ketoglutarate reductase/saccharopine dehydrogenase-like protein (TIGR00300 family)|uniref:Ornithine cyclodeaminase n=1 Tax=Methanothermobacter tenebrarum TaxID=680118 RepID=A0ABN6PD38_9EURY|nr:TIGR00300 family protein [Methanothermobacter tenebrarum]MDD3455225.1 TIGR00300 family protein [Methanobacteriales archaeon]MDI6881866.1 TIGR00300 family protein [Methanothermobacter sp.]MDX9692670.1 TIGR00300 family protein [Methanothermobacter sp.]BDH79135.1 TIGR00300 family protein [Methanothermobacter tenebrarum]HHW17242.1 TIGR00300 family protein [Methanothermobacter sp.]